MRTIAKEEVEKNNKEKWRKGREGEKKKGRKSRKGFQWFSSIPFLVDNNKDMRGSSTKGTEDDDKVPRIYG